MFAKRIIRYLCLDKNPLRRGVDVIEAWLIAIFAAVLLAGPFVARDIGNALYVNQLSGKDAVLQDAVSVEPGATYGAAWSGGCRRCDRHARCRRDRVLGVAGRQAIVGPTAGRGLAGRLGVDRAGVERSSLAEEYRAKEQTHGRGR
jgi:hypothetical protein